MQPFIARIQQFLSRLSLGQKAGLAAVALGTGALLVGTAYWSNQPEYTLLFGNLEPGSANRVVESLREENTPYELRDQGTAIYVPRASVHELRLRFASEGVVSEGQIGYELFDEGTLGMTDFMQKLNSKRALEGELAHTISNIDRVDRARVHLVKPERNPFRSERNEPSASVVLDVGRGALSQPHIQGITELVAGAVEGMGPEHVTILGPDGALLSDPNAGNENVMLTSTQLDMQKTVETRLSESGQSMLEQVLGPGNALVRVSAELDFDRTVTERNTVDPESRTVISEERMREDDDVAEANSTVRNYEISRSQQRSEESVGDVSRLTVSVILNYKKEEGDGETEYVPRSEDELGKIESLVKNAVGFKPERGDRFAIQQARFSPSRNGVSPAALSEPEDQLRMYLRYGLMALALGAAVWMVRSIAQRLTTPVPPDAPQLQTGTAPSQLEGTAASDRGTEERSGELESGEEEELVLVDDIYTSKLSDEAKARIEARSDMFEEVQQQAQEHPEETAELIRSWLVNDRG
jgi:flagellar M-ring protein FliF